VEGDSRALSGGALRDLCALSNIIGVIDLRMKLVEHVACMGKMRNIWIPGALSLWVKRPGREADHSRPSSAEVKNGWSCTSTLSIRFHGVVLS
jgi:hypothetical protein